MNNKTLIFLISFCSILIGCNESSKSNDIQIKSALLDWLATQKSCVMIGKIPNIIAENKIKSEALFITLDALVEINLLKKKKLTVHDLNPFGTKTKSPGYRYDITQKGKPFAKQNNNGSVPTYQLCYGKIKLNEIKEYSEPEVIDGIESIKVIYNYSTEITESWAITISEKIPDIKKSIESNKTPLTQTAYFIKDSNGTWKHKSVL